MGKEDGEGYNVTLVNPDMVKNLKTVFIWDLGNSFATIMKSLEIFFKVVSKKIGCEKKFLCFT